MSYPTAMMNPSSEPTYNRRFEEISHRYPDRVAFRLKTPEGYRAMTYGEVFRQSQAVAIGLVRLGYKPGSRVAILSENRPEWVIAYLGIYLAGVVAVPLDPQISAMEWRHLLEDSEAQAAFVSGLLLGKLREAVQDRRPPLNIVCFDPVGGDRDARTELVGLVDWATSSGPQPDLPESRSGDVAVIIYTSGTTGKPKGVMLTQDNIVGEIDAVLTAVRADENDILLCLLPLQHVLASIINVLLPLSLGAQVVFADTLRRTEILEALREAGITILATVPQFFYLFHDRIKDELSKKPLLIRKFFAAMLLVNRFCLRFLRMNPGKIFFRKIHQSFGSKLRLFVSGGSAFDPKVAQDFHDMGFTILQGYGLTETTGACTVTRLEDNVIGSVGQAVPGVDVTILDPDAAGVGEVLIRGRVVMKGYYKSPGGNGSVAGNEWFHSGDLGRVDARGNLFITGRKKEVIVLANGKNIYPDELETHYLQSPYIKELAVLGIPEPGGRGTSERLHAVVVPNFDFLREKKIANAREILRDEIARMSNQLPQYKRLMSYQIQKDPLPRTTTRKIKRLELKRLIESGQLKGMEAPPSAPQVSPEDARLMESAVGQVVLNCLRETYHREVPEDLNTNLELDLSFDSMERVELLASLAEELNLALPEDFGGDIFTVRDLMRSLEQQVIAPAQGGSVSKQSWNKILSVEALNRDTEAHPHFAGTFLTLAKYVCLRLLYYLTFKPFLRLEAHGIEALPRQGPFLICPNHLSYLDPFVVLAVLPYRIFRKVFFVGASEFFTTWYMKLFARLTNIVPVDPDTHLLGAMKVGAYGLRQGRILCIFPEGARSFDGQLKEFKKGAAILAREVDVPIVPVGIQGTYEVWARDSAKIRLHKVKVTFGSALVAGSSEAGDPYLADTRILRETVQELLP